jgi:YD repeat-containing protein
MEIGLRTLSCTGAYTPTVVTGLWDAKANCTIFKWNASATKLSGSSVSVVPDTGIQQYDYLFRLLNTNGTAFCNELGEPITMDGVMTLGGGASAPVSLQQSVTQLAQTAQVQNRLSHNAFGEVSEEYDGEVYDRAVEMTKLYGGTADAAQVRTTFAYNALGELLTKTDPQTHVTAANGYRCRPRPAASSAPLGPYSGSQITYDGRQPPRYAQGAAPRPC